MTRLSVVIPVHDAAAWLREAVASAVAQEGLASEVLVYDDGSTDGSAELADELAREYGPRVRVIRGGENRGVATARNRACESAASDLIAFLDADDALLPGHLRRAAEVLDADPATALVFGRVRVVREAGAAEVAPVRASLDADEWGGTGRPGPVPDAFRLLLRGNFVPTSTVVCRRSVWREAGGFETGLSFQQEDHLLWTRIAYRHRLHELGACGARYRVHPRSYTARRQNESTASAREHEYLRRTAAWIPGEDRDARRALGEAWEAAGQRALYRLYRCLRGADAAGAWREARALVRVPHKRALLSAPRRWRQERALLDRATHP